MTFFDVGGGVFWLEALEEALETAGVGSTNGVVRNDNIEFFGHDIGEFDEFLDVVGVFEGLFLEEFVLLGVAE